MTQHPPVHHPKHPVLGFHGWDEPVPQSQFIWSVFFFFFFFSPFFSPQTIFWGAHCFSSQAHFGFFFSRHPNHYVFFGGTPTYPSNLPTSPSTLLILLTPRLCLPPSPTFEIHLDQGLGLQSFRRMRRNKRTSLECLGGKSLEQS